MELGGNAPFLVFDDADLDVAVREAMVAKMRLGGQSCVAANRFLVQDGIADDFARRVTGDGSHPWSGSPGREDSGLGPAGWTTGRWTRLNGSSRRVEPGALFGPGPAPARAEATTPRPTVLDHVPPSRDHARGSLRTSRGHPPVLHRGRSDATANATEHGLAAYLITSNIDRARRVASRLQTGMVGINRGLVSDVAAPFGGVKQSGLGREGGPEGLQEYQQIKYLSTPGLYV